MDDMDGSGGALLDSNHSHFILVDNGTEGKYGVEIDLRSKIEEAIMKLKTESRTKAGKSVCVRCTTSFFTLKYKNVHVSMELWCIKCLYRDTLFRI